MEEISTNAMIKLYEKDISKMEYNNEWSMDMALLVIMVLGFPFFPYFFVHHFFLYTNNIVVHTKYLKDLHKKLNVVHQFHKIYKLPININKTKHMIIKSKKRIYPPIFMIITLLKRNKLEIP
jgi:hypothetical protein